MNPKHLEILQSSIDEFNRWRQDNPDTTPDLREANLTKTNLAGANLTATFHQVPGWDFSFVKGLIGGTLFSAILWGIIILIIFNCV